MGAAALGKVIAGVIGAAEPPAGSMPGVDGTAKPASAASLSAGVIGAAELPIMGVIGTWVPVSKWTGVCGTAEPSARAKAAPGVIGT